MPEKSNKLTPLEEVKVAMNSNDYIKQITNYYRGRREEAMIFLTAAVEYIRKNPKLINCDRISLLSALVQSAQFRFMPSGVSGEAYIIPYGSEAKFQIGYQGIVTLMWRTEKILGIQANIIYENDEFSYEEGLNPHLTHRPAMFGKEKGNPIGVYTVVETAGGGRTFKVMDKEAVMKIKDMSKAKNTPESPWNSKDPELWMWKKTCLIQHSKLLPKTREFQQAIEKDFEGEGLDQPVNRAAGVHLVDKKELSMGNFEKNNEEEKSGQNKISFTEGADNQ